MKNIVKSEVGSNHYKVILRHGDGWQEYDTARLHISVPPEPIFDPRTQSILDWSVQNFDKVTLYLHDTIQRYNLMASGLDESQAYKKALENGDVWLRNNILPGQVFIDVVRWNKLLEHPDYTKVHQQVCQLYKTNSGFSDAIDHDLDTFAERCRKRGEAFGPDRMALSRTFLLEEVAAYIPLYRATGAVDMLPGMRMKAMQLLLAGTGNFGLRQNLMISVKTYDTKPSHPDEPYLNGPRRLIAPLAFKI